LSNSIATYDYGLERISALNGSLKTQYVYDGRGSVAQTLANLPTATSHTYTPFGEMLTGKQTGFGFNAEWYDAATGMQNLRARQYEPAMMRFSQKDIVRGHVAEPLSLNRYLYVQNDPINFIDPSGMFLAAIQKAVAPVVKVATAVKAKITNTFFPAQSAANHAKVATLGPTDPFSIAQRNASPKLEAAYQAALKDPKNAHLPIADRRIAAFAQACAQVTNNYAAYWNRKDGYFTSEYIPGVTWYTDQGKMDEAVMVLMAEAMGSDDGTLLFIDLAVNPLAANNKLNAMQALLGSTVRSTSLNVANLEEAARTLLTPIHGKDMLDMSFTGLTADQILDIYQSVRDTRKWDTLASVNIGAPIVMEIFVSGMGLVNMIIGSPPKQIARDVLNNANYAQTTYSKYFSAEGQRIYSALAGKQIRTVNDLANALISGAIKPADVPIDYIVRDGNILILNTRTTQALTQAGVPRSQWNAVNRTGEAFYENSLNNQLTRNNLTSEGTSTVEER